MTKDYEKMWSDLVAFIQNGEGDKARAIWDEIVESAWKYDDMSNS